MVYTWQMVAVDHCLYSVRRAFPGLFSPRFLRKAYPREPILYQAHIIYRKYFEFFPSQEYFMTSSCFRFGVQSAQPAAAHCSPEIWLQPLMSHSSRPFGSLSHPELQLLPPTEREAEAEEDLGIFSCWRRAYQGGTDCPV